MTQLYKTIINALIIIVIFTIAAAAQNIQTQIIKQEPYVWKNVQIVGGGFVDGIVFHPTAKGVCYCRTDMGGAYRRNEKTMRWEPLLDWLSYDDRNLMGVESIALDPSDPNRVYLACGTYTFTGIPNGAVLRSDDRGKTFQRTDVPFKMGANENGRGNGERMAVDPNEGKIIYLGTRHAGLWKSIDRGASWNRVESFPDVTENPPANIQGEDNVRRWQWLNQGSGIVFVIFDGRNTSACLLPKGQADSQASLPRNLSVQGGKISSTIYAGVSLINRENLFCSIDAGKTWHPVPGQPVQYRPTRAVLTADGNMYITYGTSPGPSRMNDGAVWKFNTNNNEWTNITPDKPDLVKKEAFGYAAVSVDAHNPQVIIASSFGRPDSLGRDDIFRSTDGGRTWKTIFGSGGTYDFSLAPYVARTPVHWLFDIEIDPANSNHVIFTTGYGGYETFNLTDVDKGMPTKWSVMSTGIEETVALDLLSPPTPEGTGGQADSSMGVPLISAIGDYAGFVHRDLDKPSPEGNFDNPRFGNTSSLACAENNPDIIVRVGRATNYNPGQNIGYSLDDGKTWQPTESMPKLPSGPAGKDCRQGSIAVSADGKVWIWAPDPIQDYSTVNREPQPVPVFYTTDRGTTWFQCKGIPNNTRIIADRVNPAKFYAMDLLKGKLYTSKDGGANFTERDLYLPGGIPDNKKYRGDNRGGQDRIYAAPKKEGDIWIAAFDGLYHSTDTGNTFSKINGVQEILAFGFGKEASLLPKGKADRQAPTYSRRDGFPNYPALYMIGIIDSVYGIFRSDNIAKHWVRINDDTHQWGMVFQITGDPKLYGRVYVGTHGRGIFYGDPLKQN